jgi:hypothetical protein
MPLRRLLLLSLGFLPVAAMSAAASALADSPSGFVRAQAASPVHWHVWNEAALAAARTAGRPVYVFIGSPLSELSRATVAQTFGSEKTVAWLNENFFCIFIDADLQPEVASLGQHFINTVKQLRGWPVHLWLTPDTLQPYDGANYLPPSEEWGKPGFLKSARAALDAWVQDPARAHAMATEAAEMMHLPPLDLSAHADVAARLAAATKAWVAAADPVNGGFGSAPKLPEPELIRFLLARGGEARETAVKAARALAKGALRDPVDGGFYRRCIDEAWKEPYYQKTLADQARIALALFETAAAAKDDKLRAAGLGALDFVLKELRRPDGSFYAALDGTLEENADPAKRPAFTKVGSARMAALAVFAAALQRSGEPRLVAEGTALAGRLVQDADGRRGRELTAADYAALALTLRGMKNGPPATRLLEEAGRLYFDKAAGAFMATPAELPAGIAVRVPASGETPSAEALALLAGVDPQTADLIRRNLLNQIEYDELPSGDILLGLAAK